MHLRNFYKIGSYSVKRNAGGEIWEKGVNVPDRSVHYPVPVKSITDHKGVRTKVQPRPYYRLQQMKGRLIWRLFVAVSL